MTEVQHESEAVERAALVALHGMADAALREELGMSLTPVGDGLASIAGSLPASAITLNRVIGLGLKRRVDVARVEEAAARYRAAGAQRFFLHVHPDAKRHGLDSACANAGLCKGRGWQKFERGIDEPIPAEEPDLEIREAGPGDASAFGRIIADAFDLGEAATPWIARLPSAPGWRAFVALVEGEPAGTGALFVRDGHAFTDFGATAPSFRRRGVQRSLLAHRVREALAADCVRIHTCTGEDVPGDPQHSYANIKRCGFRESYVRENWTPGTA